jgi:DNA ligase-1
MASRDIFAMLSKKPLAAAAAVADEGKKRTRTSSSSSEETTPDGTDDTAQKPAVKRAREDSVDDDGLAFDSDTEKKDLAEAKALLEHVPPPSAVTPSSTNSHKPILYSEVAEVFGEIEKTTKRLEITQLTSDFFLKVLRSNPDELVPITYLFINRLGPDYEGLELGLGETILIKTISESTGKSTQQVRAKYKETGDLGLIALQARAVQPTMFKPKPLTVHEVFDNLKKIALASGKDSQTRKMNIIKRMLTSSGGLEAKFLIRSLESKLRIGLAEKTVLISLAKALITFEMTQEEGGKTRERLTPELFVKVEEIIRDAFCQVPNYETLIKTALQYGILNLQDHCTLRPGIPLKPMLAKPTKSITEVLDKFEGEEFICEYKYDGERAQVHLLNDGTIKVFSRNSEDMSQRYPDIIDSVRGFVKDSSITKSLILDCEAVAWDRQLQKILPFQVLTTRKRKDVQTEDIKIQVCLFAFDILCHNDIPLINEPLRKRKEKLEEVLNPIPGRFQFATSKTTSDTIELQAFLDESIANQCEGLMVKTLSNDPYRPSQRSNSWLKLKKDYLAGVGDSLDLVVIGAYYGKGKRTGTYGGFLLASYNQDSGEYETCCKIGTGFSDDMLKQLYADLSKTELTTAKSYYVYDQSAKPDVWLEPTTIFEVLTADLSLSPVYKAGASVFGRGVSLRFPRFIRIREDKSVEDATSSDQVVEFYERQANNG